MFVTNWILTTKIQKISEITNFFRHYFLSRTEVPKLSFDVKADKVKAIADYVRTHVSSISFLGKAKGLKVKSAILEPGTIQLPSETDSHWNVSGHVKLGIEKEDGVLENNFFFTCDCELSKGDEGEPIVTGLTRIQVGERI